MQVWWIGLRSMASAAPHKYHKLVSDLADPPSTIRLLFDISLTMPSEPCMLVSLTFRRPTILFSITFCGTLAPDWGHPPMLAVIQPLQGIVCQQATSVLAMKIDGTAGQPAVQRTGVWQDCPLSPKLLGIFFDGLHDSLLAWALAVGVQLTFGRWVSSLVCADDVVLLFQTSHSNT